MMKLKKYLEKHKITHAAFAEKIGVTQVTINRYVRGERFPSAKIITKISDVTKGSVKPSDWYVQTERAA